MEAGEVIVAVFLPNAAGSSSKVNSGASTGNDEAEVSYPLPLEFVRPFKQVWYGRAQTGRDKDTESFGCSDM